MKRKFSFRPRFELTVLGKEMTIEGTLFAHSFDVLYQGQSMASIQKKIISWGDAYEIEIHSQEHTELYLFVIIILDQILHEKKH
jgi:uncharacterized protein YxjI